MEIILSYVLECFPKWVVEKSGFEVKKRVESEPSKDLKNLKITLLLLKNI